MPHGLLGDPKSDEMQNMFNTVDSHFKKTGSNIGKFKDFTVINMGEQAIAFKEAECLGKGAFGKVYIGQDKDGNCFAVKQEGFRKLTQEKIQQYNLQPGDIELKNANLKKDFLAEKETERTVLEKRGKHKGYAVVGDQYYAAVRLEKGKELFKYVWTNKINFYLGNRKKISKADTLSIALQAAYDVHLMHSNNIIHADIKPENLMVSTEHSDTLGSQITIASIDHGFSNILKEGEKTITMKAKGTPGYAAPEIVEAGYYGHKAHFSFASDIFALGHVFKDDLGLKLPICNRMISEQASDRPTALEVMAALVDELKKQPFKKLDQKAIELISVCETQINTDIKKRNLEIEKHNKVLPSTTTPIPLIPLKKTFKEEKVEKIINNFQKKNPGNFNFLNNPPNKDADQKAIELKGYLLLQKQALLDSNKSGFFHSIKQKKISSMITDIDKISRKATFLGESGCITIYNKSIDVSNKNSNMLNQARRTTSTASWKPEPPTNHPPPTISTHRKSTP